MTEDTLTFDEFYKRFTLIKNHIDTDSSFDGEMFETYGEEADYVFNQKDYQVWTIAETDDGEFVYCSGIHYVNRIGYLLTKEKVPEGMSVEVNGEW